MLAIKNLTVVYPGNGTSVTAIEETSFFLAAGQTCAIIGPSGCGKSTLLDWMEKKLCPWQHRSEKENCHCRFFMLKLKVIILK